MQKSQPLTPQKNKKNSEDKHWTGTETMKHALNMCVSMSATPLLQGGGGWCCFTVIKAALTPSCWRRDTILALTDREEEEAEGWEEEVNWGKWNEEWWCSAASVSIKSQLQLQSHKHKEMSWNSCWVSISFTVRSQISQLTFMPELLLSYKTFREESKTKTVRKTEGKFEIEEKKKRAAFEVSAYLLERRSMLLSGREKLESTVQESDMLTWNQYSHHSNLTGNRHRLPPVTPTASNVWACWCGGSSPSSDAASPLNSASLLPPSLPCSPLCLDGL